MAKVWNGLYETAPQEGETFVYKGETFVAGICNCGNPFCKRPSAYRPDDTNHENEIEHLEIRLRGPDEFAQGKATVMLLLETGKSYTEIADASEAGKSVNQQVDEQLHLWASELQAINSRSALVAFMEKHNIREEVLAELIG